MAPREGRQGLAVVAVDQRECAENAHFDAKSQIMMVDFSDQISGTQEN